MKKLIVATKNKGKLGEIQEVLAGFPFEVISMARAGIYNDIEEVGITFEENALIKAMEVYRRTGEMTMADDSGLEVDYLNGAPGIYSSRFAGEGATDADRNNKLLKLLEDVPYEKRTARFVSAIAVVFQDGSHFTVKGTCEGHIGLEPAGDQGFGYDPLFNMPEFGKTMAQMNLEEKNRISHRGKALKMMVDEMKRMQFKFDG